MSTTITIPSEYRNTISQGKAPVDGLVAFLNDHVQTGLLDYESLIDFGGYEDDNETPRIIPLKHNNSQSVISITANLEYRLLAQHNSCTDNLASIPHSASLIYTYQIGDEAVKVERDPEIANEPGHREYGY